MLRLLLFSLSLSFSFILNAQEPTKQDLFPCGTPPGISPWLKKYAANPDAYPDNMDTIYVRMKMHLLANDNGSGRITPTRLLDAFCRLNADFEASNVRFFFDGDWNEINNSAWFNHPDIPAGIDMMLTNDIETAINSYMCADPAGNCGYNLPYASVAISHGCAGPNDHTWAHEIGHNLTIQHPFIGWEGKRYNPDDTTQTPTQVTYDYTYFHDTIDVGPTPLDTAYVEYLDGSNCTEAADLFCMTPPDYLAYRWQCDANSMSTVKQRDPNGKEFYSDGSNFMSYAEDECSSSFTADQIAAMRANLMDEKAMALATAAPIGDIANAPEIFLPMNGVFADPNNIPLLWSSVPNATKYLVQVSRLQNFAFNEYEVIVSDTSTTAFGLLDNKTYYWRVRPFNEIWTCQLYSATETFKTDATLDTRENALEGWKIFPTLCASQQPIFIKTNEESSKNWAVEIYDFSGKRVFIQEKRLQNGQNQLILPDLTTGAYCIRMSEGVRMKSMKIFVK